MPPMGTITELLRKTGPESLAIPSNVRLGTIIYKRGGVEVIEHAPKKVEAWAGGLSGKSAEGGSQRRHVTLTTSSKGLSWNCTGNPKKHQIFCKHCVAVALAILDKS